MHGVHIHGTGRCEGPDFKSAGGHFDPGPAGNPDPDVNHPYHMGDLPNITVGATGTGQYNIYSTRVTMGGPIGLFDADGSAIVIHQNLDPMVPGPSGSGVSGGPANRLRRHRTIGASMQRAKSIAVAIALSAATAFVAAQAQPPAPPGGGRGGGGGGQGRGGGGGGAAAPGAPARGITDQSERDSKSVRQDRRAEKSPAPSSSTSIRSPMAASCRSSTTCRACRPARTACTSTPSADAIRRLRERGRTLRSRPGRQPRPGSESSVSLGRSAEHRRERDGSRHSDELHDAHQSRRTVVADRRRRRGNRHSPESRHESDRHQGSGRGRRHAIACGVIVK